MEKRLKYYLTVMLLAALSGFLVALVTFLIVGEAAYNLPGGSIASGFSIGLLFALEVVNPHRFNYIYPIAGIFSGLIGFLIFLAIFV